MSAARRLTAAQALIEFLSQQYVERDGREIPFSPGSLASLGTATWLELGMHYVQSTIARGLDASE